MFPELQKSVLHHLGLGQVQTHSCGLINVKATFCMLHQIHNTYMKPADRRMVETFHLAAGKAYVQGVPKEANSASSN